MTRYEKVTRSREELTVEDRALRRKLEGACEGDANFRQMSEQASKWLLDAASKYGEGVDRARSFAAAVALVKKLLETERGKASVEFMDVSERREEVERDLNGPLTKV